MNRITQLTIVTICVALLSGCQTMGPNARAGTGVGGTMGALTGAAIGSRQGNALEGALIGGTLGGLAGATIGDAADEVNYHNRIARQNQVQQIQQAAVTTEQLAQMSASGLSEELIINQIQTSGVATNLSTNDLINLKQRGVSDRVISAYQNGWRGRFANQPSYPPAILVPYGRPLPRRRFCPDEYYPPPRYGSGFDFHIGF